LNDIIRFDAFLDLFIVVGGGVDLIIVSEERVVIHSLFQINYAVLVVMGIISFAIILIGVVIEIFLGDGVEAGDDLSFELV
jgi:hypothetical protein